MLRFIKHLNELTHGEMKKLFNIVLRVSNFTFHSHGSNIEEASHTLARERYMMMVITRCVSKLSQMRTKKVNHRNITFNDTRLFKRFSIAHRNECWC